MGDVMVRAVDLSRRFVIRKDKSLKEWVVNSRRKREHVEEFWALRDIDLEVDAGHTVGLIGHNGSGKSTLLKIIGGILAPTTGYVERRGRLAGLLELGAGFHGDLTGRENVYLNGSILGLKRREIDRCFDSIVDFSGIEQFIDTQVKFYSSGMYVRLAFAVAVHVDPDVLLVDEVIGVGDEPFQRKCLDRIKEFQNEGKTIVLVTHSLDQARQICDRVVLLDHGRIVMHGEPALAVREFREVNADIEAAVRAHAPSTMTISKVRVLDADGIERGVFDTDDRLTIDYEVTAVAEVADWAAGIAIVDPAGTVVYGTNTALRDIDLAPLRGSRSVRFHFDDVPLAEGQYFVTVAVHPRVGADYDRVDRATSFQVRNAARDAGMLSLRPSIEVERSEGGRVAGR
ncbi:MAG TPA: ABC transporter ATP-binding protein [Jatrophihabitantaceae bacterium]|nr:ABC transporter ATP-binding protein [Jatrophihabitantaceae bacterium]